MIQTKVCSSVTGCSSAAGLMRCSPTACPSAAASAAEHLQKANDLVREAVGCTGLLARPAQTRFGTEYRATSMYGELLFLIRHSGQQDIQTCLCFDVTVRKEPLVCRLGTVVLPMHNARSSQRRALSVAALRIFCSPAALQIDRNLRPLHRRKKVPLPPQSPNTDVLVRPTELPRTRPRR